MGGSLVFAIDRPQMAVCDPSLQCNETSSPSAVSVRRMWVQPILPALFPSSSLIFLFCENVRTHLSGSGEVKCGNGVLHILGPGAPPSPSVLIPSNHGMFLCMKQFIFLLMQNFPFSLVIW